MAREEAGWREEVDGGRRWIEGLDLFQVTMQMYRLSRLNWANCYILYTERSQTDKSQTEMSQIMQNNN